MFPISNGVVDVGIAVADSGDDVDIDCGRMVLETGIAVDGESVGNFIV